MNRPPVTDWATYALAMGLSLVKLGLIYDTLFALYDKLDPKPQMVGKYNLSEDRKTHTFELRDGLKFSDGTAVTARDCVASIRRWAARDGQLDDLDTPPLRMLFDDQPPTRPAAAGAKGEVRP